MRDLTIRDLVDLVAGGVPSPDARLEQMFKWHFERDMEITKWLLGSAASLAVALLVALFTGDNNIIWWKGGLLLLLPLAASSYGLFRLHQLRTIQREFVSALRIHAQLAAITPFIKRYRLERKS